MTTQRITQPLDGSHHIKNVLQCNTFLYGEIHLVVQEFK